MHTINSESWRYLPLDSIYGCKVWTRYQTKLDFPDDVQLKISWKLKINNWWNKKTNKRKFQPSHKSLGKKTTTKHKTKTKSSYFGQTKAWYLVLKQCFGEVCWLERTKRPGGQMTAEERFWKLGRYGHPRGKTTRWGADCWQNVCLGANVPWSSLQTLRDLPKW